MKRDNNVFKKILCHDPKNITNKRFRNLQRIYSSMATVEHGYIWSEKDIQSKEDIFEDVFNQFYTERFRNKLFPKGTESITQSKFILHLTSYSNYFDLNQVQKVVAPEQPIGWIFSHVKVNFVFKQYLYQMGNFKVNSVDMSPEA